NVRDKAAPDELRNTSLAALHFRLVEVATIFLLPMLAIALGVPPKRSPSAIGIFLSIVMIVTYHKINEYGESLGSLGLVDPFVALWGPFIVFAALIYWMFYTIAYVPGGQPIGWLERGAARLGKLISARIPGRRAAVGG
ncbi:MAG: LPS export ABC transporter permease LptF, partial [Sphingomonas sp.]|nr:LPS export ABC transporter permease LptF [Sphingomonas sp.]